MRSYGYIVDNLSEAYIGGNRKQARCQESILLIGVRDMFLIGVRGMLLRGVSGILLTPCEGHDANMNIADNGRQASGHEMGREHA